jgi:dienelactone hydrolase
MTTPTLDARQVRIPSNGVTLDGDLVVPQDAAGIVLFAHGSGSSRHSPRNKFVASELQQARLATLLMDLLTREEEAIDVRTAHLRFDITLLGTRLVSAIDWVAAQPDLSTLGVGCFGASTGAAAALVAAAARPSLVRAVVSRGGRADLAGSALPRVKAPTLLIVGGEDTIVIDLNEQAKDRMSAPVELEIVPRASHLFEEPGTLEAVARLAATWFAKYLPG